MTNTPPILLDFPDRIETERLILRPPHPGDGAMANAAIRESQAELAPWFPWVHPLPEPSDTEQVYRRMYAEWHTRENLQMIALRKADDYFLGGLGLMPRDWRVPYLEIGYWLRTSATGQGYMTEAVNGLVGFAFEALDAQRLEIRCDARNERSAAVARRCGFTYEGRLRNYGRSVPGGELFDLLYFSRLQTDATGDA